MKLPRSCLFLCLVLAGSFPPARAENALIDRLIAGDSGPRKDASEPAPQLDPKRIINASNSFLKEKEPEMTGEEYALYEKISTMAGSQPEFALKLLEAMMNEKEPPSPAFEFILGNVYYSAGQVEKAEARYLSAVKRFPTFIRGWSNLGVLYYSADKYAEASPCFSKAVTLGDHDPGTLGLLGYCLERTGNLVTAEMAYMQALAGNPDNADWMEGLLRIFVQGKQYGRAEALVRNLIKLRPTKRELWLAHANILLAENRKREAMVMLEASVGAGLAGSEALNLLGDLYAEQGLNTEAADIYQRLLAVTPVLGEQKLLSFARVLIAAGRLAPAEDVLHRLQTDPASPAHLHFLQTKADLQAARGQWPEARRTLQDLLQIAPLDGNALLGLGHAFAAEDDLPRAAFAFEAAFHLPAVQYRASLELANLELKNRHYEKSAEYLQKALSIENSDAVQDFLARVKTLIGRNE